MATRKTSQVHKALLIESMLLLLLLLITMYTLQVHAIEHEMHVSTTSITNSLNGDAMSLHYKIPQNGRERRTLREIDTFHVHFDYQETKSFVRKRASVSELLALVHGDHHYYGENDLGETLHVLQHNSTACSCVTGSLVSPVDNTIYQIRPDAHGNNLIYAKNPSEFGEESSAPVPASKRRRMEVQTEAAMALPLSTTTVNMLPQSATYTKSLRHQNQNKVKDYHRPRNLQDKARIDNLVVWTRDAECGASNLQPGCTTTSQTTQNMRALVDLAVSETNTAFDLTGISAYLNLVYAYPDYNYQESSDIDNDLQHLSDSGDGYLDEALSYRTQYGADVVALLLNVESNICGRGFYGYPNPSADIMFSAVAWSCATGYYSFGHELGHNFGCDHDRGDTNACTSTRTNFGYRNPNGEYRDIMATDCSNRGCDNIANGPCVRVQHYSEPAQINEGGALVGPIGNDQDNCAGQIKGVVNDVSAFLDEKAPANPLPAPTTPASSPSVPITPSPTSATTPEPVPITPAPTTRVTPSPTVPVTQPPPPPPQPQPATTTFQTNPPVSSPATTTISNPATATPPSSQTGTSGQAGGYCGDGYCTAGENCHNCNIDCPGFSFLNAKCGNGVCEVRAGENSQNCPYDCRGGNGLPFACGAGFDDCNPPECNQGNFRCSTNPVAILQSCCGDGSCSFGESAATCSIDCGHSTNQAQQDTAPVVYLHLAGLSQLLLGQDKGL